MHGSKFGIKKTVLHMNAHITKSFDNRISGFLAKELKVYNFFEIGLALAIAGELG